MHSPTQSDNLYTGNSIHQRCPPHTRKVCMKKSALIACLLFFCLLAGLRAEAEELIFATDHYPPYHSKTIAGGGYIHQAVVEAFRRVGHNITVQSMPFARALVYTQQGEITGIFTLWHRKEREKYALYSDPLPANDVVFFKRKENAISYTDMHSLKPYTIGTVIAYAYPPAFTGADYLNKEAAKDNSVNMQRLISGRVDLAVMDLKQGIDIIRNDYPQYCDQVDWIEPPLERNHLYLAASRKAPGFRQLIKDFNRGMAEIKADGTFREIMLRNGIADTSEVKDACQTINSDTTN